MPTISQFYSAADHRDELLENWRLAEAQQPLNLIEPLE